MGSSASPPAAPRSEPNEQIFNGLNSHQPVTESYSAVLTNISSSLASTLRWCPTSEHLLEQAEADLLAAIKRPFKAYFVNIGAESGRGSNLIRTLELLTDDEILEREKLNNNSSIISSRSDSLTNKIENTKHPLLMVHGFGAGLGTWILNYDTLASKLRRKVYAIDLLGFGRSSRSPFDLSGDVEAQFVDSIEKWRQEKGIEKFIILGHSFGGYLSACYALKYPQRTSHLILADPWGVQDRSSSPKQVYRFPLWVRAANSVFQHFNPLAILRATGPYGPRMLQKFRSDLREKFRPVLDDDCHKFLNYIYHCNAQAATGEAAFKSLTLPYGWPKNPLINRLVFLDESVGMTFIYGSRSWIDKSPGENLRECLTPERVTVNVIQGSGHHVYADKYNEFNELILEACKKAKD